MTEKQRLRANEIANELKFIERALCRTNPNKMYSLNNDEKAIATLAQKYEDEFCVILVRHKQQLEEEFEQL